MLADFRGHAKLRASKITGIRLADRARCCVCVAPYDMHAASTLLRCYQFGLPEGLCVIIRIYSLLLRIIVSYARIRLHICFYDRVGPRSVVCAWSAFTAT